SGLNMPASNSANDVYVLDGSLKTIGSVTNLGLQERIYSARFIADKGYVVTFRQTDPFYVIDLKDPKNPKLAGELKIPGYSGYLHPISKDKILGIGQENWQVKLALFDVSDPQNPKELDKYLLKEGYSDAINNHRAFLLDQKHQVFFLPAQGAYIFSYKDDKLQLAKALSVDQARRAVYINDYLYVFSNNSLIILDENNWEKVKSLDLK
ncbi:MAG TPA: beta-propeller domain-containing protein, partial [Candidatus Pacearchaeota archaeon]|nr:beta-propeller domain-containing protein [Candidatus Pacearchaeota archaeon]